MRSFRKIVKSTARKVRRLLGVESILEEQRKQNALLFELLRSQDIAAQATSLPIRQEVGAFLAARQLGLIETLERIRAERLSLARIGDGELRCMFYFRNRVRFQRSSAALANDLKDIAAKRGYEATRLLVGLPDPMRGHKFWQATWAACWPTLLPLISGGKTYGNAMVTRTQFFEYYGEQAVDAWRSVWNQADVCFLTGKGSRFGTPDALFSNIKSKSFLYSTPRDAYEDLPRFLAEIEQSVPKETLCLISLGPAGTVLAAKLAKLGYWALDIGHISNCYAEAFGGGMKPEIMPISSAAK